MVITERDQQILNFFAKWRFGTIAQLRKAGIFSASYWSGGTHRTDRKLCPELYGE